MRYRARQSAHLIHWRRSKRCRECVLALAHPPWPDYNGRPVGAQSPDAKEKRPGDADSLDETTLTGEGYLDDDASGGSQHDVEPAASSGCARTQAAGPGAVGFRG